MLYYSAKEMGKFAKIQRNICVTTLVSLIILSLYKFSIISAGNLSDTLSEDELGYFKVLGLAVKTTDGGKNVFDVAHCFTFEGISSLVIIMLIIYYKGQIDHASNGLPFKYIYHSEFLKMYPLIHTLFFITIGLDTFFS
jgi:hypothetical protein